MNGPTYSVGELLAVLVSRELEEGGYGIIELEGNAGAFTMTTGVPTVAAELARRRRGIDFTLQHGLTVEPDLGKTPRSLADPDLLAWPAAARLQAEASLDRLRRGQITVGFTSAAQIDRRGNLNTVCLGPRERPFVRLRGPGIQTDQAAYAGCTFVLLRQTPETFVHTLDFRSAPGFGDAPGDRTRLGLRGGGPRFVFTDLAVWDFCAADETLRLHSIHPGTDRRTLAASVGFEFEIPASLPRSTPPDVDELRLIRNEIDPRGLHLDAATR